MKTLLQKPVLFSLAAILWIGILSNCDEKAQERSPAAMINLWNEEYIDLGQNEMDSITGRARRHGFRDSIHVDCSSRIFDTAAIIDYASLNTLRGYALNLKGNDTGPYVLGFAMTYGLNTANNKIKLLFKPVYIKKTSPTALKTNAAYSLTPGPVSYQYAQGRFVAVNNSAAQSAIQAYRDHISFKDKDRSTRRDTCRRFENADDVSGDVKFVLYPFQETDSILSANAVDSIYIFHIGEYQSGYFKHGLLLGSEHLGFNKELFYAKYGNLSHLCPPSCNTITLNVK